MIPAPDDVHAWKCMSGYQIQLTVSIVDANSARRAMDPNGPFEQRNSLDMVLVAVPFGLRWVAPI